MTLYCELFTRFSLHYIFPLDINVLGVLQFPADTPRNLPTGSCVVVYILKHELCFTCYNPKIDEVILRNPTLTSQNTLNYELTVPKRTETGIYTIQATLNVGWCKNGNEWIRKGDYKNKFGVYLTLNKLQEKVKAPVIKMEGYGRPSIGILERILSSEYFVNFMNLLSY